MIKNSTSIAILMATYNGEQFIREQLDSLFAQTYTDWTLFVRDDGSKDNTISIIESYQIHRYTCSSTKMMCGFHIRLRMK